MSDEKVIYVYKGDGLGIPGLPHRLTRAEAKELGQLENFDAAVKAGVYKPEQAKKPAGSEE